MSFRLSLNNFSRKNGEGTESTKGLTEPSVNPAVVDRYKRFVFFFCL